MRTADIDFNSLLEHQGFLRRFALDLIGDEQSAEDLVQETWLAALLKPPGHTGSLRAWLARVLRNRAFNRARANRIRDQHELYVARDRVDTSSEDLDSVFLLHGEIVEELGKLREPYRRAIYLRYYREWSPKEIAAEEEVPLATVRTRLRRGLDELREALDRRYGGKRTLWCAPLAGLVKKGTATSAAAPTTAGALGGLLIAKAVAGCVAIAALVWLGWGFLPEGSVSPGGAANGEVVTQPGRDRPEEDAPGSPTAGESVPPGIRAPEPEVVAAPGDPRERRTAIEAIPRQDPSRLAVVQGRFVDPQGRGAAGVSLELSGRPAGPERMAAHAQVVEWENLITATDAEGHFRVAFDPPPPFSFVLRAKPSGYAALTFDWDQILPGATEDLGEVRLLEGGTVVARILDADGLPLTEGFYGRIEYKAEHETARAPYRRPDPVTGEMRFEGVLAGSCQIHTYFLAAYWTEGPEFELETGELLHLDFAYNGPDLSRRIKVLARCDPFYGLDPGAEHVQLVDSDLESHAPTESDFLGHTFDDLEPGSYTVEIDDPRFLEWRREGVQPGQAVQASLKGNCSVRLTVLDGATGSPLDVFAVSADLEDSRGTPRVFSLLKIGEPPPVGGLVEGLVPMKVSLIVTAPGFAEARVPLGRLEPGQSIEKTVSLRHGRRIAGVVHAADGKTPVPGIVVGLLGPGRNPGPDTSGRLARLPFRPDWSSSAVRVVVTDASGRFSFSGVGAARYTVRATAGPGLEAEPREIELAGASSEEDIRLQLPPRHALVGKIVGPPGARSDEFVLRAIPRGERNPPAITGSFLSRFHSVTCLVATDGSYRIEPLPTGRVFIELLFSDRRLPLGESRSGVLSSKAMDLGVVDIEAEGDTVHDFDLREFFPGFILVQARISGGAMTGLLAQACPISTEHEPPAWLVDFGATPSLVVREATRERSYDRFDILDHDGSGAAIDEKGIGRIGPVFPGQWMVSVRSPEGAWIQQLPGPVSVNPAEEVSVTVDVELVAGRARLLDSLTGRALARQAIQWSHESVPARPWVDAQSNDDGQLELLLPSGEVELRIRPEGEAQCPTATILWTRDGPVPAEVMLPRE